MDIVAMVGATPTISYLLFIPFTMPVSQQPIVENNNGVFTFYKIKEVHDLNNNIIQIKEVCRSRTIEQVNTEITKLNVLRTKRVAEYTKGLENIDRDIAKQQEFLSLMV